ncbi:MAG: alpha-hydroxy acid oxidase, partial [Alphaproteobacteria bacterium]
MQNDLDVLTLQELVKRARTNLPDSVWDYVSGASETETTMKRNRMGIDRLALTPRVCADVSAVDCSGTMLGRRTRMPVFLAPIGSIQQVHAPGATTGARAAGAFGIYSFLSSVTDPDMETVAREASGPKVFQLYVRGDRAWMADIVRRAVDSGYDAFCLTVDTAMYSRRERDILKRHVPTGRLRSGGFEFQAALNWDDVKWFKDSFDIPLVIKGIATAEDSIL